MNFVFDICCTDYGLQGFRIKIAFYHCKKSVIWLRCTDIPDSGLALSGLTRYDCSRTQWPSPVHGGHKQKFEEVQDEKFYYHHETYSIITHPTCNSGKCHTQVFVEWNAKKNPNKHIFQILNAEKMGKGAINISRAPIKTINNNILFKCTWFMTKEIKERTYT